MQLRGEKLLIYPKAYESIETFLNRSVYNNNNCCLTSTPIITHVELACLSLSSPRHVQPIVDFVYKQNRKNSCHIERLTVRCCEAPGHVWKLLLQALQDTLVELQWQKSSFLDHDCLLCISQNMRRLTKLTLHSHSIHRILPSLYQNACLEELILDGSYLNTSASIQALMDFFQQQQLHHVPSPYEQRQRKGQLRYLSLKCCQLNEESTTEILHGIAKYLKHLTTLNLLGNQSCRDTKVLAKCLATTSLKHLDLSYQQQASPTTTTITTRQESSNFSSSPCTMVAQALMDACQISSMTIIPLQSLRLAGNNLKDVDMALLASALSSSSSSCSSLQALDLSANAITTKGLMHLLSPILLLLHPTGTLKHVNLKHNLFDDFPTEWLESMHANYTLECLEHSCFGTTTTTTVDNNSDHSSSSSSLTIPNNAKQIAMICQWNKLGRKLLRTNHNTKATTTNATTPIGLWPLVLANCGKDSTTILHLLQNGPCLLEN